ncbi:hypothetical protein BD324DRAFT_632979 [Kockovaella imperatae]|uniref:Large ribosomal subunit protein mL49 n=1 Tax=Kockovaella imperatae TaxID=4999 RepID=A0A1Y1UBU7_9TREE|nr:hypothetical protein BD324DRAFT_632979 [Kockovaella imperatae]ORX35472.1 hypothetical protein BD324DRAFT_632979 [Kockovaella imperatae]
MAFGSSSILSLRLTRDGLLGKVKSIQGQTRAFSKSAFHGESSSSGSSSKRSRTELLPDFNPFHKTIIRRPKSPPTDGPSNLLTPLHNHHGTSTSARGYHIVRPLSGDYPVYTKIRKGGHWTTIIKGVRGNVEAFQQDLNAYFKATHIDPLKVPSRAVLRPTNLHLVMKGKMAGQIVRWLKSEKL